MDSKTDYAELSRHVKSDSKKTIEAARWECVGSRPMGYLSAEEKKNKETQAKLDQKKALADSFKTGDKVTFKVGLTGGYTTSEVTGKDDEQAVIEYADRSGKKKLDKISYKKLTRVKK